MSKNLLLARTVTIFVILFPPTLLLSDDDRDRRIRNYLQLQNCRRDVARQF
jgi:hypothetical protein